MAVELDPALAAAIEAHKAADARVEAHEGPEDVPPSLVDAETAALEALALTPCDDDEQFFCKMDYMLANQRAAFGPSWAESRTPEILTALSLHLLPPDGSEEEQDASSKAAEMPRLARPLTLLNIVDRLHVLVNHARAVEFACKGASLDNDTTAALLELTMQHHDQLKELLNELEAQTDAEREAKR